MNSRKTESFPQEYRPAKLCQSPDPATRSPSQRISTAGHSGQDKVHMKEARADPTSHLALVVSFSGEAALIFAKSSRSRLSSGINLRLSGSKAILEHSSLISSYAMTECANCMPPNNPNALQPLT